MVISSILLHMRIHLRMGVAFSLQVTLYCVYVSIMAFTAKVSDPAVGGTYMTLLNTVTNLGTSPSLLTAYILPH